MDRNKRIRIGTPVKCTQYWKGKEIEDLTEASFEGIYKGRKKITIHRTIYKGLFYKSENYYQVETGIIWVEEIQKARLVPLESFEEIRKEEHS